MSYQKSDFAYELPEQLIARYPLPERSASRLLLADGDRLEDLTLRDLPRLLSPADLLIFNNTRVMRARLFGHKAGSGGRVEILVERILDERQALAQLGASKTPKAGTVIELGPVAVRVRERREALFLLELDGNWWELLEQRGELPIPPYFHRPSEALDQERYQTVFARELGAVAAPTAGLHFDEALLAELDARAIPRAELTLHVGAGTFAPVRCEDLRQHRMHAETYDIPPATLDAIAACRARGGRVIAIGTTSLRSLESWGRSGQSRGDTDIFITPPYDFRVVDALFTNFHLPESTLIMLVSAALGYEATRRAYAHAIAGGYRFFSYGDAMFIPKFVGRSAS